MSQTQEMSGNGFGTDSGRSTAFPTLSAAGSIHDLGNLIQVASSAVNIVARNPSVRIADLEPDIAGAKTSLEHAGALIRQTIGLVREQAATAEPVKLAAYLSDVEALFGRTAPLS